MGNRENMTWMGMDGYMGFSMPRVQYSNVVPELAPHHSMPYTHAHPRLAITHLMWFSQRSRHCLPDRPGMRLEILLHARAVPCTACGVQHAKTRQ